MIDITDKAVEKARTILAVEGKDNWGLRICQAEGACCGPSYCLDLDEQPTDEDRIIEKDGLRVFVDKDSMSALMGMQLDYHDDGEHEGFILSGGQAPSCGSGGGCSGCG